jgi:hypothetical protein
MRREALRPCFVFRMKRIGLFHCHLLGGAVGETFVPEEWDGARRAGIRGLSLLDTEGALGRAIIVIVSDASSKVGIGKVFIMFVHGTRGCLVCERLITRDASRAHCEVPCDPAVPDLWLLENSSVLILPLSMGA